MHAPAQAWHLEGQERLRRRAGGWACWAGHESSEREMSWRGSGDTEHARGNGQEGGSGHRLFSEARSSYDDALQAFDERGKDELNANACRCTRA